VKSAIVYLVLIVNSVMRIPSPVSIFYLCAEQRSREIGAPVLDTVDGYL